MFLAKAQNSATLLCAIGVIHYPVITCPHSGLLFFCLFVCFFKGGGEKHFVFKACPQIYILYYINYMYVVIGGCE